jgi:hypothetical protein
MKKRRVIFLIELETNDSIRELKESIKFHLDYEDPEFYTKVVQIQSNVVQKRTNPKSRGKR